MYFLHKDCCFVILCFRFSTRFRIFLFGQELQTRELHHSSKWILPSTKWIQLLILKIARENLGLKTNGSTFLDVKEKTIEIGPLDSCDTVQRLIASSEVVWRAYHKVGFTETDSTKGKSRSLIDLPRRKFRHWNLPRKMLIPQKDSRLLPRVNY